MERSLFAIYLVKVELIFRQSAGGSTTRKPPGAVLRVEQALLLLHNWLLSIVQKHEKQLVSCSVFLKCPGYNTISRASVGCFLYAKNEKLDRIRIIFGPQWDQIQFKWKLDVLFSKFVDKFLETFPISFHSFQFYER